MADIQYNTLLVNKQRKPTVHKTKVPLVKEKKQGSARYYSSHDIVADTVTKKNPRILPGYGASKTQVYTHLLHYSVSFGKVMVTSDISPVSRLSLTAQWHDGRL